MVAPTRGFEPVDRRPGSAPDPEEPGTAIDTRLRVVSWNILAQAYVKKTNFPHSPPPCLKWKHRSGAVTRKLLSLDADFLCLQELDEFKSFYEPVLLEAGYECLYLQRPSPKRDGCGIIWKHKRFLMVAQRPVRYNDLVPAGASVDQARGPRAGGVKRTAYDVEDEDAVEVAESRPKKSGTSSASVSDGGSAKEDLDDPKVRLKRDCVGLMAAFQAVDSPQAPVFIVATTHIYWDPALADVKLAQVRHMRSCLASFSESLRGDGGVRPAAILTGDFNSRPGEPAYEHLVATEAAAAQADRANDEVAGGPGTQVSGLAMQLVSSYKVGVESEPYTIFTPPFTFAIDFVFFTPSPHLELVSRLALPSKDDEDVVGGLPNMEHPSDHVPIGAEFNVKAVSL
eukprot:SM000111S18780  [mRNA]  locus=s111:82116:84803:+ [translate_table: standard]